VLYRRAITSSAERCTFEITDDAAGVIIGGGYHHGDSALDLTAR
jgi:hypothetical protein